MPMDIEFVVRDAYGLVRPDWKLAQTLRDAGTAFAEACKDNYQDNVTSTRAEVEEMDGDDGEIDGELEARGSREGSQDVSSSDEAEVSLDLDSITQDLSLYHFKVTCVNSLKFCSLTRTGCKRSGRRRGPVRRDCRGQ